MLQMREPQHRHGGNRDEALTKRTPYNSPQQQGVLQVGPGRAFSTISAAVDAANADTNLNNAYDVQVLPGTYTNDFPTVTRPVTIEVDPCCAGQAVVLNATIDLPNQKGIILALASLTVNGLTFQGAHTSRTPWAAMARVSATRIPFRRPS